MRHRVVYGAAAAAAWAYVIYETSGQAVNVLMSRC